MVNSPECSRSLILGCPGVHGRRDDKMMIREKTFVDLVLGNQTTTKDLMAVTVTPRHHFRFKNLHKGGTWRHACLQSRCMEILETREIQGPAESEQYIPLMLQTGMDWTW